MIAGDSHPDHDTLCAFRRNNPALINESFVRVLEPRNSPGGHLQNDILSPTAC